ncbi:2-oxo-4-hydroxy-4-carboxy-5-ureidoimidazoline decarboxylase [Cohnella yongneupensis]|uniref:2-oxo-4-hydroxy-4-carboxy-5-ureidoimidazoline decarboxylase n=1 Tax=Cohnella yongneupensis TaxID=425006 RepID=A0ABW0RAJ1_9BACL
MMNRRKIPMLVVSKLSREQFVAVLGGIFEHAPWIADKAWESRPFRTRVLLHDKMLDIVRRATAEAQLGLLRGHPDLATRLKVTEYSSREQQSAGLDQLTEAEYESFMSFNKAYTDKFGFPFIMAVKGRGKEEIMAAMQARIENEVSTEMETAFAEIRKITGFRLEELLEA